MRHSVMIGVLSIALAQPLLAQRDSDTKDRLGRRDIVERPEPALEAVAAAPTNNAYIKIGAVHSDGDVTPSGTLGLRHKGDQHPWYGEFIYKYKSGAASNKNVFSGAGMYQFWTGTGSLEPLMQVNASHSIRPGSNRTTGVDITGEITLRQRLSLDAIAAYNWLRPKNGDSVSDFAPGISVAYLLDKDGNNLLSADYTLTNDVDEEDSFAIGYRHVFQTGYSLDVVAFKHNDVLVRVRKNFKPLRPRSM